MRQSIARREGFGRNHPLLVWRVGAKPSTGRPREALADAFRRSTPTTRRGRDPDRRRRHVLRGRRPQGRRRRGRQPRRARRRRPDGADPDALSKPVIAAVEGHAVAGGLELAIWGDLRVAARDAVFGVFCRRWGVPARRRRHGALPRLIGQSRALDLILTGRRSGPRRPRASGWSTGWSSTATRSRRTGAGRRSWPRSRRRACGTTGSARASSGPCRSRRRWPTSCGTDRSPYAGVGGRGDPVRRGRGPPRSLSGAGQAGAEGPDDKGTQRRGAGFLHPCFVEAVQP